MEKLEIDLVIKDEEREIKVVYMGYSYFGEGDILIAKVTPCFENGNTAIVEGLFNRVGFSSTKINTLRVNSNSCNRFIYYRLQENQFTNIAVSEMIST